VQAALLEFLGMEVTVEQSQRAVRMHAPKGDGLLRLHSAAEVAAFQQVVSAVLERDRIRAERAEAAEQRRRLRRRLMQEKEAADQAKRERRRRIDEFLALQNRDTSWSVRLVALVPYMLPAVDSCWMFGEALGLHSLAGVDLHSGPLADLWGCIAPALLFVMPMISNRRRLPVLLRYNLNQAYVFQLLNYVAFALSWSAVGIQACLAGDEALRVPEAVQPTLLPGAELVLLANVLCVVYSAGATLLGVVPEHIPVISREVRRSTYHTTCT
jgi:hypothetical protein